MDVLLAAALATAAPQAEVPAAPEANPAIFVVRDADTTVFIFGTFHVLDGKSEWFSDRVRNAFESSNELVLETIVPNHPVVMPPRPAAFTGAGQAGRWPVAPSASFLATTRMAIDAGRSQGMKVGNGADMILREAAETEGKQVEQLETIESQLAMFTRMPPSPPASEARPRAGEPVDAGNSMQSLSNAMSDMQSAWKRGDQTVFVRMLDQLRQNSPETYKMLFADRNARWADWIAARMQTPGTVFVAVGAGHLAGKDSVLVRLAEMGIESSRLN